MPNGCQLRSEVINKQFFVFGKSVVKAKFFSPKIHRQKNATRVQYGKWLNSWLTEW
jgi:hypothetical protein